MYTVEQQIKAKRVAKLMAEALESGCSRTDGSCVCNILRDNGAKIAFISEVCDKICHVIFPEVIDVFHKRLKGFTGPCPCFLVLEKHMTFDDFYKRILDNMNNQEMICFYQEGE